MSTRNSGFYLSQHNAQLSNVHGGINILLARSTSGFARRLRFPTIAYLLDRVEAGNKIKQPLADSI
jgi:hypothetical protein